VTVLSLFSGIGGFDLGAERAGMTIVGQCELDPFCRAVLAKHWPNVWLHDDVRTLCRRIGDCDPEDEEGNVRCPIHDMEFGECPCVGTDEFVDTVGGIDVIVAGFECQDISIANWTGAKGTNGSRSGLYSEVVRIVCELRPRFLLLENSAEILGRGLGDVLGTLAQIGYDAEWCCVPASLFGSPHRRERWYAVAYPTEKRPQAFLHDTLWQHVPTESLDWQFAGVAIKTRGFWATEPAPPPVDDGLSSGVVGPRLRAIGNAVVPQVAEVICRAVMQCERATT